MKVTNLCLLNLRGTLIICGIYLVWIVVVILLFTATTLHDAIKMALVFVSCLLAAPILGLFFVHKNREAEARMTSYFVDEEGIRRRGPGLTVAGRRGEEQEEEGEGNGGGGGGRRGGRGERGGVEIHGQGLLGNITLIKTQSAAAVVPVVENNYKKQQLQQNQEEKEVDIKVEVETLSRPSHSNLLDKQPSQEVLISALI